MFDNKFRLFHRPLLRHSWLNGVEMFCSRPMLSLIIIIIMFYCAIMAAKHTVQYTHIQSYAQINPLKTQKDFFKQLKTVKKEQRLLTDGSSSRFPLWRHQLCPGTQTASRADVAWCWMADASRPLCILPNVGNGQSPPDVWSKTTAVDYT